MVKTVTGSNCDDSDNYPNLKCAFCISFNLCDYICDLEDYKRDLNNYIGQCEGFSPKCDSCVSVMKLKTEISRLEYDTTQKDKELKALNKFIQTFISNKRHI
jgi:hypothetical protein